MGIELFPHNKTAYESVLRYLKQYGRAAVIHPTGTGKSMIAFKLAEEHPHSRILWLAPSAYIFRTQLENLGSLSTFSNIVFMTYAGLMSANDIVMEGLSPDYIVLDEFHRCGAAEWGKGVQRILSAYPNSGVLGLSATAVRYLDGRRDMAQELFEGHVASEMTLGEAIVKQILPAPVYIQSFYAYQEELLKWEEKVSSVKNGKLREAGEELLQKLRRAVERADGLDKVFAKHMKNRFGKYIVFCTDKAHMEEMKLHVSEWFERVDSHPHIYTVYYGYSGAEQEFSAFKADKSNHLKLLFSIDLLNEGVHVGDIDGVILLRPTVSPTLYLQQIGRSLAVGKTTQPVIFDVVNNFESLCCIDSFRKEMQAAFYMYGSKGIGEGFFGNFQIIDEVKDCRELFLQLKKNLSADFEMYFHAAVDYRSRYGDLNVPKNYTTEGGLTLGTWMQTQRRVREGKVPGILTKEQILRLDGIGMIWDSMSERNWEKGVCALENYRAKYGNADVKASYVTEDGFRLGRWVGNLRQKAKKENPSAFLTEKQRCQLEAVGMIWNKNAYRWEQNYQAAKEYFTVYGNLEIPAKYCTKDGRKLGVWIQNQRQAYIGKKGSAGLTETQIQKLEEIGMVWRMQQEAERENPCHLLGTYYKNQRNCKNRMTDDFRRKRLEAVGIL